MRRRAMTTGWLRLTAGAAMTALIGCAANQTSDTTSSDASPVDVLDPAFTPAWAELVRAGAGHEPLARLTGTWDFTYEYWMWPGAPRETGAGEVTYESLFEGRYVRGRYDLRMEGGRLRGEDLMGYNAYRGEYESLWIDNSGTQFMSSTGVWDESSSAIVLTGVYDDIPLDRRNRPFRNVMRLTGPDTLEIEMYAPDSTDELFLSMRLTGVRRAGGR